MCMHVRMNKVEENFGGMARSWLWRCSRKKLESYLINAFTSLSFSSHFESSIDEDFSSSHFIRFF